MTDRLAKLEQLHAADPDDPELMYMLALEHGKAGASDEALRWLDRVIDRDPHFHYAYFQKAKTLAALGREAEAKQTLTRGLDRANLKGDVKASGELAGLLESFEE